MRKDIKSLEKQVAQLQQQLATIIATQSANRAA
jgi:phage shock protein A